MNLPRLPLRVASQLGCLCIALLALAICPQTVKCQESPTRNEQLAGQELHLGVRAYKEGDMDRAAAHFRRAKDLDPKLLNVRLYLATAYASQYIPGAPSEENARNGEMAVEEFRGVLEIEPNNLNAIDGMGSILSNIAHNPFDPEKFEESKRYHKRHIELAPQDPDPYYWVGFINWTLAYRANDELRSKYNQNAVNPIQPDEPLPPSVQAHFVALYWATVEEGIEHLYKAVELKPDYASAYAYLNLHYRLKADMVTAGERESLLNKADDFVEKYKELKQKELERAQNPPEPKP